MDTDPVFDWNADLADVSNVHQAEQVIQCSKDVDFCSAPWRLELPQGGVIKGEGCQYQWPFGVDSDLPANLLVVSIGTSGAGEVVENNTDKVLAALFAKSGMESTGMAKPEPPATGMPLGGDDSPLAGPGMGSSSDEPAGADSNASSGDGGCTVLAVTPGPRFGAALAGFLGVFALLLGRRRRG
jgi:hypothetical protein